MKLSEQTIKILKNFAGVNQSILIRPGSFLSTISNAHDMLAEANIEEEFPCEIALYDIVEFLNTLKLFKSPMFDFNNVEDNYMYIYEEDDTSFKVRYTFAKKKTIDSPTNKGELSNSDIDISFTLDNNTRESIIKASNVMQLPHLMMVPAERSNGITIEVSDVRNKSSNKFSVTLDAQYEVDCDFKLIIKMENFKIYPVEYNVCISGKKMSSFVSNIIDYYIGLDVNSQFRIK